MFVQYLIDGHGKYLHGLNPHKPLHLSTVLEKNDGGDTGDAQLHGNFAMRIHIQFQNSRLPLIPTGQCIHDRFLNPTRCTPWRIKINQCDPLLKHLFPISGEISSFDQFSLRLLHITAIDGSIRIKTFTASYLTYHFLCHSPRLNPIIDIPPDLHLI